MKRRQFVKATLGAAVLLRSTSLFAQSFDLVVRGGRVIDPSLNLDMIADIGVVGDRIAAVARNLGSSADREIDARDRIVMPGILDIHAHYAQDSEGPHICLSDGVTGWVDAGSAGADNIDEIVAVARSAPQPAGILLNIGRRGVIPEGDTADISLANVEVAKAAIARNLDYVVGVKARMTEGVTANDITVIRRAQEVASYFNLPLIIHMGQSASSMADLVAVGNLRIDNILMQMHSILFNSTNEAVETRPHMRNLRTIILKHRYPILRLCANTSISTNGTFSAVHGARPSRSSMPKIILNEPSV